MQYRLTSGFEDFGFGDTPEAAINDAIQHACHPETGSAIDRAWIDAQMARATEIGVIGAGLYIEAEDENGATS